MVKAGQIYRSLSNRHHPVDGPIRILVKGVIPYGSGQLGRGTARVVTLTASGREVRSRNVKLDQFHDSPHTAAGDLRRTGYVLTTEAQQ